VLLLGAALRRGGASNPALYKARFRARACAHAWACGVQKPPHATCAHAAAATPPAAHCAPQSRPARHTPPSRATRGAALPRRTSARQCADNVPLLRASVVRRSSFVRRIASYCIAPTPQALHPTGRLDDVAYLQRELLRALDEKRQARACPAAMAQASERMLMEHIAAFAAVR
jgi:hypothetical protein